MELQREKQEGIYIHSFQKGEVIIDKQLYQHSVIVTPTQIITDWPPQELAQLTPENMQQLLIHEPEVIILGAGMTLEFPPAAILAPIYESGIGVEVMNTSSACGTFNLLTSDGRRVIAVLFLN